MDPCLDLQVPLHKGDMLNVLPDPIFLLTYIEKPIIINSFHSGRGARVCGNFYYLPVNPPNPLWNQTVKRVIKKSPYSTRGYIFHGKATRKS